MLNLGFFLRFFENRAPGLWGTPTLTPRHCHGESTINNTLRITIISAN